MINLGFFVAFVGAGFPNNDGVSKSALYTLRINGSIKRFYQRYVAIIWNP